jgi:hypothetical protein
MLFTETLKRIRLFGKQRLSTHQYLVEDTTMKLSLAFNIHFMEMLEQSIIGKTV